jgi:hypothetical protein
LNPGGINPDGAPDVPSVYKVSLDLADTMISAGLHTLQVGSLSQDESLAWVWTDSTNLQPSTVNGGPPPGIPLPLPTDLAFQLYGASIPEPSTLTLLRPSWPRGDARVALKINGTGREGLAAPRFAISHVSAGMLDDGPLQRLDAVATVAALYEH